ncbi:MAG: glycosyltransferase family 2 protein [Caulobacterales bacterium]
MSAPRVSFIMPAYNAADTLATALTSIQAQTVRDWELIVVDDGSKDETFAIAGAEAARDPRIVALTKPNGGPASARNLAIGQARGDWLMFHDADDWLAPTFLERMLALVDAQPDCALAACTFLGVDDGGRQLRVHGVRDLREPFPELARTCPFSPIALIVKRAEVQALGGFDDSLITCEDWDMWQRLARRGRAFAQTDEALAYYRSRPGSLTRKTTRLLEDSRFVIARAHGRDPREPDDAPYADGADPAGLVDAMAQSALYIAATGLGLGVDPRQCFEGLDLAAWSFDAKVMAGVIVDAVAYGRAIDRAALASDWETVRGRFDALADALAQATGLTRQIDCLRAYLEIETRGPSAFSDGFRSDVVHALRLDPNAPPRELSGEGRPILLAALASRGACLGSVEWICEDGRAPAPDVALGVSETLKLASPRALVRGTGAPSRLSFWMKAAPEALRAASAGDQTQAIRRAIRNAAAAALAPVPDSRGRPIGAGAPADAATLAVVRAGGAAAAREAIDACARTGVSIVEIGPWMEAARSGATFGRLGMLALDGVRPGGPEDAACTGCPATIFLPLIELAKASVKAPNRAIGWRAGGAARLDAGTLLTQARAAQGALGTRAVALMQPADQDQTLRAALRQAGFIGAVSPVIGPARIDSNPFEILSVPLDDRTPPGMAARRLGLTPR